MNVFVVLQQMLVLLTMMALGYFVYRKGWLNDESYGHVSKINTFLVKQKYANFFFKAVTSLFGCCFNTEQ